MKAHRIENVSTFPVTSVVDGGIVGQRHAPASLSPVKRRGTHCVRGWLGPRTGLDGCRKCRLYQNSIPGLVQCLVSRYTEYAIPAYS